MGQSRSGLQPLSSFAPLRVQKECGRMPHLRCGPCRGTPSARQRPNMRRGRATHGMDYAIRLTTNIVATRMAPPAMIMMRHPPPVVILPTLRCRPLFVRGIPVALEILDFARLIPAARFHEKPPLFILVSQSLIL